MTDPAIRAAILAANEQDAHQAAANAAMQIAAQGTAQAISQLPVFEAVELNGTVVNEIKADGSVKLTIVQVGAQRSYSITMPAAWFTQMVERITAAVAEGNGHAGTTPEVALEAPPADEAAA